MARRLAAIMAADVVGYSRLMAADEAGTHARLKALRKDFIEPKIAEHHGRVAKLMGDGALVEFASVVDAVECAAAIQAHADRWCGGLARPRAVLRVHHLLPQASDLRDRRNGLDDLCQLLGRACCRPAHR
jgi:adenylate cyclase